MRQIDDFTSGQNAAAASEEKPEESMRCWDWPGVASITGRLIVKDVYGNATECPARCLSSRLRAQRVVLLTILKAVKAGKPRPGPQTPPDPSDPRPTNQRQAAQTDQTQQTKTPDNTDHTNKPHRPRDQTSKPTNHKTNPDTNHRLWCKASVMMHEQFSLGIWLIHTHTRNSKCLVLKNLHCLSNAHPEL
eukprot:305896-Amphidinium_carterae.2